MARKLLGIPPQELLPALVKYLPHSILYLVYACQRPVIAINVDRLTKGVERNKKLFYHPADSSTEFALAFEQAFADVTKLVEMGL